MESSTKVIAVSYKDVQKERMSFVTNKNAKHHFFNISAWQKAVDNYYHFFLMLSISVSFQNFNDFVFAKQLSKAFTKYHLGRVKRIWYLSPMRAAKVQASLRIRAVSPEPPLLAHTSSESRGTFRQKARSQALLNGWACAVKIYHDGMLDDTKSLDATHLKNACAMSGLCIPVITTASVWATPGGYFRCFCALAWVTDSTYFWAKFTDDREKSEPIKLSDAEAG